MLHANLPTIDDKESDCVPSEFNVVIDAHVHVFPQNIFRSIRRWFDEHAWHIRYQLSTSEIFDFLFTHGLKHIVALQYAHTAGIAKKLNQYMLNQCQRYPERITGMATVLPGEEDAELILQDAFDAGLGGLKLHAHVQCFDIDSRDTDSIFEVCQSNNKPVVIHIGKEPKSQSYRCDPYKICGSDKLERVLRDFPKLKICVPHLGFSETTEYQKLIEKYDTLWLDTTMVLTDYFPIKERINLKHYRIDRIMYGSDFPNIPYAWDRELKWLRKSSLSGDELELILGQNAVEFFNLTNNQLHR